MISGRSCPSRSITGTNFPEAKTALSGLVSGGCTYDDGTAEWRLYQLDTSFWAMICYDSMSGTEMLLGAIYIYI